MRDHLFGERLFKDQNVKLFAAKQLLRAWPFPHGRGRIVDRIFGKLELPIQIATVETTRGFYLKIDPSDLIGRHLYLTGEFDPIVPTVLIKLARRGDLLLDIGANIGYVSACFLSSIPNATVVAIEPQEDIADLLQQNLDQFGQSRSSILRVALSNDDGTAHFRVFKQNKGAGRLVTRPDTDTSIVKTISVDTLSKTMQRSPSLIKIDVEGHEQIILSELLAALSPKPRAIIYEDQTRQSSSTAAIGELLLRHDYEIFAIKKTLLGTVFKKVTDDLSCDANDYVAIFRNCQNDLFI